MNKRRKLQVSLAVFGIIYFIVLLVSPGWGAAKILGIISIVATFLALYGSYRADKKKAKTALLFGTILRILLLSL